MRNKLFTIICFALLLSYAGMAPATTYYVSPSGNDNNPGTSPSQAWKTISKVNSVTFAAGDSVLFEGGQTFSGSLYFDEAGTSANPITVGSYGTGRATISSGNLNGIQVYQAGGYVVKDLIFIGSGPLDPIGTSGILFKSDKSSGSRYVYVRVNNVDSSQYHYKGIAFAAPNGVGYTDVEVTNSDFHDNGDYGMTQWGAWPPGSSKAHQDFYVAYCTFYNNKGIPGREPHSGNGVEMDDIDGSLVEFCEAWNNGELNDASGGGPFGIWQWQIDYGVIQFCESHHNKTSAGDGGGFDLDGGCRYSSIQYCYSHDNYGTGYGVFQIRKAQTHTNNVIRYNISQNDSLYNTHGSVYFWGAGGQATVNNMDVYNNTFYKPAKGGTVLAWSNAFNNINLYNNIVMSAPGKRVIQLDNASAFDFLGNCYWSDGNSLQIVWGSSTYTSLTQWRNATGEEMLDGQPVGFETDPCLSGGSGDTAFMLKDNSPLINQGLNLQTEFGINPGTHDYFGNSIPQNGAYDVGAHEATAGPDTTPPTPNPMTWATVPYAAGSTSIAMVATTATDPSGVQYYFDCTTAGGHDSGWQTGTSYTDTGLSPGTQYCYRVQARDQSPNQNTTNWSTTQCATTTQPDTTPPSPNPMTWSVLPYATSSTSIAMTATTATDTSGVEYYFDCTTAGGHDSGWQDSTSYTDTGLSPSTHYCYRVQARDKSPNQNVTAWSTTECATTQAQDTTPPLPNPMTWATVPYATGSTSITMVATTATDPSGVEYYFDETSGNPGGTDSGWQSGTSYTDTGLSPNTQYCYRVQARDLSPNQNATTWSSTQCATTQPSGETQLFFDNFESGGFSQGGWIIEDPADATVENWCGYQSTYGVKLKAVTWIEKAVSTSGYSNIHVKYVRKTGGLDSGEYLYAEWWDGSNWNQLEATQDTVWTVKDLTCSSGANNNASFKVRFRLNASGNNETGFLDNAEVTGTQ